MFNLKYKEVQCFNIGLLIGLFIGTIIVIGALVLNDNIKSKDDKEKLDNYEYYQEVFNYSFQLHKDMAKMLHDSYYDDVSEAKHVFFDCKEGEDYEINYYKLDSVFYTKPELTIN